MNRSTALTIAALAIATVGCSTTTPGIDATGSASRIAVLAALAATAAREAMEAAVSARMVNETSRRNIEKLECTLRALQDRLNTALEASKAAWEEYESANEADSEAALEKYETARKETDAARAKWQAAALLFRTEKDLVAKSESLQATAEQAAEVAFEAKVAVGLIADGTKVDNQAEAAKHAAAAEKAAQVALEATETAKDAGNKAFAMAMQNMKAIKTAFG